MTTDETPADYVSMGDAIRDLLVSTRLSDAHDITRVLIENMPPEHYETALREALPYYVRKFLVGNRALSTPQQARAVLVRSARRTGILDAWRQVLEDRVTVAGTPKRLGDCTWDDLDFLAQQLRETAENFIIKAQRYEKIRDQLSRYERGAKVSDLPVETLKELCGELPGGGYRIPDPED